MARLQHAYLACAIACLLMSSAAAYPPNKNKDNDDNDDASTGLFDGPPDPPALVITVAVICVLYVTIIIVIGERTMRNAHRLSKAALQWYMQRRSSHAGYGSVHAPVAAPVAAPMDNPAATPLLGPSMTMGGPAGAVSAATLTSQLDALGLHGEDEAAQQARDAIIWQLAQAQVSAAAMHLGALSVPARPAAVQRTVIKESFVQVSRGGCCCCGPPDRFNNRLPLEYRDLGGEDYLADKLAICDDIMEGFCGGWAGSGGAWLLMVFIALGVPVFILVATQSLPASVGLLGVAAFAAFLYQAIRVDCTRASQLRHYYCLALTNDMPGWSWSWSVFNHVFVQIDVREYLQHVQAQHTQA